MELGMYWEDIIELVAAKIGIIFGLEMMKVEIVTRNGKRGCLLRNFVDEFDVEVHAEGGELLSGLVEGYTELQTSDLKNNELIDEGFRLLTQFDDWEIIKDIYIDMLLYDILIGNQDRHPYNWKLLYYETGFEFSPIYDNGASLGFHFNDNQLRTMVANTVKLNRYVKRTRVKAGLFEEKFIKAKYLLKYIQKNFPREFNRSVEKLYEFDLEQYEKFIQELGLLSEAQKEWLQIIIPYRRVKILEWIEKEENHHE